MLPQPKEEFKTFDISNNATNSFIKELQDLKKDEREISSAFEEKDKIKDIQKNIEVKENNIEI